MTVPTWSELFAAKELNDKARAQLEELIQSWLVRGANDEVVKMIATLSVGGHPEYMVMMIEAFNRRQERVEAMMKDPITALQAAVAPQIAPTGASLFMDDFKGIDEANHVLQLAWDEGMFDDCFSFDKNPILMADVGDKNEDKMRRMAESLLADSYPGLAIKVHTPRWGVIKRDGEKWRPKRSWVRVVGRVGLSNA